MSGSFSVIYEFDPYLLDVSGRQLWASGNKIPLTPKAFDTLLVLVKYSGRVVEKKELMDEVWPESFVEEATLAQNIFTLRRVLGENATGKQYIETIPKRGYRFITEVKESRREVYEPIRQNQSYHSSIAILPFDALVSEKSEEYLGFGIADTLITKLSNIRQVTVRPTRAIRKYGSDQIDPVVAGKELTVDLVLTGSIQKADNKTRITIQLICVNDATILWSDTFDDIVGDIFAVQDSISDRIIKTLTLKLTNQEKLLVSKIYTNNPNAYLCYLKGRFYWGKWTREGFEKGASFFNLAVRTDPDFALAQAALVEAYNVLSFYGYIPSRQAFQVVNRAALKAIQIDPMLAEAHAALAINNFAYTWDWATAEQEFLRAIEINSGSPIIYHYYASFLIAMGRFQDAIDNLKIAQDLDPLSPLVNTSLAYPFFFSRQYDRAISELLVAIEIDRYFPLPYKILGDAYLEKKMYAESIKAYQTCLNLTGQPISQRAYLARAYALSNQKNKAIEIVRELESYSKDNYVSSTVMAIAYISMEEKEHALDMLEESYQERCNDLVFIKVQPTFDSLRAEPRFINLIRRMAL